MIYGQISLTHFLTPGCKRCLMLQFLSYLYTDINEPGPSFLIFLRVDQFYVVRPFFVGYLRVISEFEGVIETIYEPYIDCYLY